MKRTISGTAGERRMRESSVDENRKKWQLVQGQGY